ncbi:hypothetical protein JQC67_00270 [Aurantibacter crassamenti]|uniref:hypothetical protein n=1 Tax=Aurantibacter crassamenti TaxID=1837375 RepID=UPI00193933FD|nr:hypothetical protein [Aurantibacter crassamenti]MBM1104559.1 hypothetical protein [Aurantibacter crassamenti]
MHYNCKLIVLFGAMMINLHIVAQKVEAIDKKGSLVIINNNAVTTDLTAPSVPIQNDVWFDTSDAENTIPKIWNGTSWINLEHTGTSGSIFYAGSDNHPSQDNSNLYWDSTNSRLGLGTNSPEVRLDIDGNARIRDIPVGVSGDELITTDTNGNLRKLPISSLETKSSISQNSSTGIITHNSEDGTSQTVNLVSTNTDNSISVGTDGGAYFNNPIKAYGTLLAAANSYSASGISSATKTGTGRYTFTMGTARSTTNYPIQLSVLETGTNDINIYVTAQTTTTFSISIVHKGGGFLGSDIYVDRTCYFTILDF